MATTPINETEQISAIKIFKIVEEQIKKIHTYPLSPEVITVQQDAYKRLAGQDSEEQNEVFASLEQARKEKDSDLRFLIQFTSEFFLLSIENIGDIFRPYADVGATNELIAHQIVAALTMLVNGQLSCVLTTRYGRPCAVELIYKDDPAAAPITLSIDANYPRFIKEDHADAYEVELLRNHFETGRTKMPQKFFLRARLADGSPLALDRPLDGNTIKPLTKTHFKAIMNAVGNTMAGVSNDEQFDKKVNGSWVQWLAFGILVTPILIWIPQNVFGYVAPVAGLAAFLIAHAITTHYLLYVQNLRLAKPDHPLIWLDRVLNVHNMLTFLLRTSLSATLVSQTFPVYITKHGHALVTLLQLSRLLSPLVLLPAAGMVIALVLNFGKRGAIRVVSYLLAIVAVIGLCVVNFGFTYTGDSVATPEPQTTIAIGAFVAQFVLAVLLLVAQAKKPASELRSSGRRGNGLR